MIKPYSPGAAILNSMFLKLLSTDSLNHPNDKNSIINNSAFRRFIELDFASFNDDGDTLEIPTFILKAFEYFMMFNYIGNKHPIEDKIIMYLYNTSSLYRGSRGNSLNILRYWDINGSFNKNLIPAISNSSDLFYGNKGIIFNREYEPLFLTTVTCKRIKSSFPRYKDLLGMYTNTNVHISPKVFIKRNAFNNYLIKNVIPYFATTVMPNYNRKGFSYDPHIKPCSIIIDDMSQFFKQPIPPKNGTKVEEEIKNCILDSREELIYSMV